MPTDLFANSGTASDEQKGRDLFAQAGMSSHLQHNTLDSIIKSAPFQAVLGAGDSLNNQMANLVNLVPGLKVPMQKNGDGLAYQLGGYGGDVAGFLAGGDVLDTARMTAEAAPLIGKGLAYLGKPGAGTLAKMGLGGAIYGAVNNPNNRLGGAAMGGGLSLAGEAIPFTARGIGSLAESVNPEKFTNSLVDSISNSYKAAKKESSSFYQPVMDALGKQKIYQAEGTSAYKTVSPDDINNYYGTTLRKMHNEFIKNPTLENAHDLQSQLGSQIRKLQSPKADANTLNTIDAFSHARDALKMDMDTFVNSQNPELAQSYNIGSQIYAKKVAPYYENSLISKLATGTKKTVTPKKLQTQLINLNESGKVSSDHYLSQALSDLSNKINKGQVYKDLSSILGGGAIGEAMVPGEGGGLVGALTGKMIGPSVIRMAQNPVVTRNISKVNIPYQAVKKSLIAAILASQGGQ